MFKKKKSKEVIVRGNTRLAIKVGFWYTFATFLTRGIAFITTPIFSRVMTKADYGEFSNFASWQATLLILVSAELYSTVSRAYYDYKDDYDKYVSSIIAGSLILSCVYYLIFMLCGSSIYNIVNIPPQYVHIMFFTMMCMSCRSTFLARERTLYHYKKVILISIVGTLLPTIISVFLVCSMATPYQLSARIYGFYIPSSMVGLTCAIVLLLRGRSFRMEHIRYALKLSIPLLVNYLTIYLLTSTNVIITKSVLGKEQAAVMSIAASVIHILTALFHALSGAVTTWIMDNINQQNYSKLRRELSVYTMGISILALGVILLAPEVVFILGGKAYLESVRLIPFYVLSVLIHTMMAVFTIILTYDKNIKATAISATCVSGLSIFVKIWLLPLFSLQILTIINSVAFAILFTLNYIFVRRAGYAEALNLKGFLLPIGGVLVFCLSSFYLYENDIARYAVIAVIGICFAAYAYKNKQTLLNIIKKKKGNKKVEASAENDPDGDSIDAI